MFSLAIDWCKRVWIISEWYSPIFKTVRVEKNIWRIINTIASISCENMHWKYSFFFIICSQNSQVSLNYASALRENCLLLRTNIRAYFRAKWRLLFIFILVWLILFAKFKMNERFRNWLSESQGLWTNSRTLWLSVKWTEEKYLNAWLQAVWPT